MEDSRNIIKAIDAITLKAGGGVVDSKNITEAIDNLKAVYDQKAIGLDTTLTQTGLAADAKVVGDMLNGVKFKTFTITKSSSTTFTVPNNSRMVLFISGGDNALHCGYTVSTSGIGALFRSKLGTGTKITETVSVNTLTIANGSSDASALVWAIVFAGDITVS